MSVFFDQIRNSTLAWVILAIIAIASFVWGIYSHISNNRKRQFTVAYSSDEIVKQGKNAIRKLKLSFGDREIDNLTISKFAIWNSGNKTINADDIVPSQKLRIIAEQSAEILEAQIVSEVEPSNLCRIDKSTNKEVCIDFNYIDSHEGMVVQILHTGDRNSLHEVKCKIKGGQAIKYYTGTQVFKHTKHLSAKSLNKLLAVIQCFMSIMASTIILLPILSENGIIKIENTINLSIIKSNPILDITAYIFCVILCTIIIILSFRSIRIAFMVGIPEKLKTYYNNSITVL